MKKVYYIQGESIQGDAEAKFKNPKGETQFFKTEQEAIQIIKDIFNGDIKQPVLRYSWNESKKIFGIGYMDLIEANIKDVMFEIRECYTKH